MRIDTLLMCPTSAVRLIVPGRRIAEPAGVGSAVNSPGARQLQSRFDSRIGFDIR